MSVPRLTVYVAYHRSPVAPLPEPPPYLAVCNVRPDGSRSPGFTAYDDDGGLPWMYLVIAGTGTVIYDPEPVVLYRQHESNSVGEGRGPVLRLVGRVPRQVSRRRRQAQPAGRRAAEAVRRSTDPLRAGNSRSQ